MCKMKNVITRMRRGLGKMGVCASSILFFEGCEWVGWEWGDKVNHKKE
jgi:hypothetical protein